MLSGVLWLFTSPLQKHIYIAVGACALHQRSIQHCSHLTLCTSRESAIVVIVRVTGSVDALKAWRLARTLLPRTPNFTSLGRCFLPSTFTGHAHLASASTTINTRRPRVVRSYPPPPLERRLHLGVCLLPIAPFPPSSTSPPASTTDLHALPYTLGLPRHSFWIPRSACLLHDNAAAPATRLLLPPLNANLPPTSPTVTPSAPTSTPRSSHGKPRPHLAPP